MTIKDIPIDCERKKWTCHHGGRNQRRGNRKVYRVRTTIIGMP
jgi:hypothetical protein